MFGTAYFKGIITEMKILDKKLVESITTFSNEYVTQYRHKLGHLPVVEKDDDWPSPCLADEYDQELVQWRPQTIEKRLTFENVEQALHLSIHSSIKQYFSVIYSENMPATCEEGNLQLLFPWSEKDFQRLQQNIIGHILMKQKLKQDITVFFAVTDDDDIMLTVNNQNGEVWAERVGCVPHKKIANNLTEFINSLSPDIYLEKQ